MIKFIVSIQIFFWCLIFFSCSNKSNYLRTRKLDCDSKLYVEKYANGVIDVNKDYLTDSNHFRIYVGSYDAEHDFIHYGCNGDSINVEWIGFKSGSDTLKSILQKKVYSIKELQLKKVFD